MDTHIPQMKSEDDLLASAPPPPAAVGFFQYWREARRFAKVMAAGRRGEGKDLTGMTKEELLAELTS